MTTFSSKHRAAGRRRAYARLYKAVILRAVEDLTEKEHRHEARKWLLSSDSEYAFAAAGINPSSVRQQMI
jgi:hypothetical protein